MLLSFTKLIRVNYDVVQDNFSRKIIINFLTNNSMKLVSSRFS